MAHHRTRYEWEYVYGFVCPETGESEMFLFPSVSTDIMSLALGEFAEARGFTKQGEAGEGGKTGREENEDNNHIIILLIDQA